MQTTASTPVVPASMATKRGLFAALPERMLQAFREHGGSSFMSEETASMKPMPTPASTTTRRQDGAVVVDASKTVAVPVLDGGNGLRTVIQRASAAGLRVQPMGSGLAREQVPAAGTMVPVGTSVVVRFAR